MTTAATISARLVLDSSGYMRGLSEAERRTQGFQQKLGAVGGSLTQLGGMATAGFTVPIVGAAYKAGEAFSDLDTQMKNIQSITQDTDENTNTLRSTFLDWSTDLTKTRDSAEKLAEGYYFIQSSGFAGAAGMEVLRVSTKAASAGLTDTMVAGNAILATLNAYGMEAEDAAWVSDVLFKTVDVGVLTFEDLASQLGDVVSTASALNVGIDEVGAAMGLMTRKGIQAPEAVTALNQLMLQFISPSSKMKKAAKELGIEWDMLTDTLEQEGLEATLERITTIGGEGAVLSIFGDNVRALKGALALTEGGAGTDQFEDMLLAFNDVGGRTEEAFATQTKSVSAQMDNFKNKMTVLGVELAEVFVPVLLQLVDVLKPIVDWLSKTSDNTKMWMVIIAALLAVVGPILVMLGLMATAITAIGTLIGAIGAPVLAVIAAIAAAIAFLATAWALNWGGIRDTVTTVWNAIKLIFQAFQAAINGDWYKFGELLRQAWDTIWNLIEQRLSTAVQAIRPYIYQIIDFVISLFNPMTWAGWAMSAVMGLVNGIRNAIPSAVQAAKNLGSAVSQAFKGFFGIRSPSTLMEWYGKMAVAGFQQGIQREQSGLDVMSTLQRNQQSVSNLRYGNSQQGAQAQSGVTINITNPKKETAEESIRKSLKSLSYTGVMP